MVSWNARTWLFSELQTSSALLLPAVIREYVRFEVIAGNVEQESIRAETTAPTTSRRTAAKSFNTHRSILLLRLNQMFVEVRDEFPKMCIEFSKLDILHWWVILRLYSTPQSPRILSQISGFISRSCNYSHLYIVIQFWLWVGRFAILLLISVIEEIHLGKFSWNESTILLADEWKIKCRGLTGTTDTRKSNSSIR